MLVLLKNLSTLPSDRSESYRFNGIWDTEIFASNFTYPFELLPSAETKRHEQKQLVADRVYFTLRLAVGRQGMSKQELKPGRD